MSISARQSRPDDGQQLCHRDFFQFTDADFLRNDQSNVASGTFFVGKGGFRQGFGGISCPGGEMVFLQAMGAEKRRSVLEDLLRCEIPALIVARSMEVFPELIELAQKHGRTLLRTDRKTVDATSEIIDYLNKKLAPQITRHGVLMNINGQGVLILS